MSDETDVFIYNVDNSNVDKNSDYFQNYTSHDTQKEESTHTQSPTAQVSLCIRCHTVPFYTYENEDKWVRFQ